MSSMLEQAIIDAEALRESAVKNAEQAIIDKYSEQIKEAVETLLEQEDDASELDLINLEDDQDRIDLEVKTPAPREEPEALEESKDLDLDELENYVRLLEGQEPIEEEVVEEEVVEEEMTDDETLQILDDLEDEMEDLSEDNLEEDIYESILEELVFDEKVSGHGHLGAPTEREMEEANDVYEIQAMLDEKEEENKKLKEQISKQEEIISVLNEKTNKFKNISVKLKEHLTAVNVSNAKLLYTNKVLSSTSLNERQKVKIVEAISKTETVNEAKVIYETLQSSVGSSEKKKPESLNEAVSRRPSLFLSRRQEREKPQDPTSDRWKKLAGLN